MNDRFVLIGLARSRQGWFAELARWSTAAVAPIDYLKCLDPDEVRALFGSGRRISALLVDAGLGGVDRELFVLASSSAAAVFVVDDGRTHRDWESLGAAAVLDEHFERGELMEALTRHARTVDRSSRTAGRVVVDPAGRAPSNARLIAVAGAAGAGTSTVAMAIAQTVAAALDQRSLPEGAPMRVALVDGTRRAAAAMAHDVGDVLPGLPELVEAHRHDELDPSEVRRLLFSQRARGYDLLLGARRPRDLAVMRPAPLAAAIDALRRSYDVVVIEHDPDLDGEDETGSIDVEELHGLARRATALADLVVAVGRPGMWGLHRHVRLLEELDDAGLDPRRVQPVVNHASPAPGQRALHTRTLARLIEPVEHGWRRPPLFLAHNRHVANRLRGAEPLPQRWSRPLARLLPALLAELADLDPAGRPDRPAGKRLAPGELGTDSIRPREVA